MANIDVDAAARELLTKANEVAFLWERLGRCGNRVELRFEEEPGLAADFMTRTTCRSPVLFVNGVQVKP